MKKKILLYGVATFKNRGVEAIVQSTIKQMEPYHAQISIATHDYIYNQNFYSQEVHQYIPHYRKGQELTEEERKLEQKYQQEPFDYHKFELLYQSDVVRELENCDISISVGGDNYCYPFCTWLYALDKKAHELGKKTVLWGASLFEEITDKELIHDMNYFDVLVIRESISYRAIQKYVPEEKLLLAKDPAFSLLPKKVKLNPWYQGRKIVGINISPLTVSSEESKKAIFSLVRYLLDGTDYSICLLPHVTTEDCNDLDILRKIKEEFLLEERVYLEEENYNCNELKYIISTFQLLVAARTHASIAAYSSCVPVLVIGYSVKSKGIAKDIFGSYRDYVISSNALTPDSLLEKFAFLDKNQKKIKKKLQEVMPSYMEDAKTIFPRVLAKLEEQEQKRICRDEKCIGCWLCAKVCPHGAIAMKEDEFGFVKPEVDLSKCIHCNLCHKKCPVSHPLSMEKYQEKYYACKNKDTLTRMASSSGGIFSLLAEYVLSLHGVVYGCEKKNHVVRHARITKKEEIARLRGSKYVQSKIDDVLEEVSSDLQNPNIPWVLFSGTPCQIGALKSFLGKEEERLLTVAVACHGVSSSKLFSGYQKELENEYQEKIKDVNFRTKANGWSKSSIQYSFLSEERIRPFTEDAFMDLYLKNLILRESCYECPFKMNHIPSDIILGDYWGIEVTHPEFFDQKGVSLVIVNSRKMEEFLKEASFDDKVEKIEGSKEDAMLYNPNLFTSFAKPKERILVLKDLEKNTFDLVWRMYRKDEDSKVSVASKINLLEEENSKLKGEIDRVYNSRRWKIVDKVSNNVNRVIGRK